jgi:hypothetical protein
MAAQTRMTLEELLLRHNAISEEHLDRAREEQKKFGGDLGRILVDLGYVSEELLIRALAHQLGIPLVNPEQQPPPIELVQAFPVHLCERFGVIPVEGSVDTKVMRVASSTPGNQEAHASLAQVSGFRIELAAATSKSIERAIRKAYYGDSTEKVVVLEAEPAEDLAEVRARIQELEKTQSNPHFAALLARVERLEQIGEGDRKALKVLSEIILEQGFITREELRARLLKT